MRGRLLVWEIVVVPSYFVYTYMCTLFGRGGVLISRVKLKHSSYVRMHVSALIDIPYVALFSLNFSY